MKHRWVKDKYGNIVKFQCGDYHQGPKCAECGDNPCEMCNPECLDEECEGRGGFKIRITKDYGNLFGIRYYRKSLYVGIFFVTVDFDFSGLFPYCEEIEDDD